MATTKKKATKKKVTKKKTTTKKKATKKKTPTKKKILRKQSITLEDLARGRFRVEDATTKKPKSVAGQIRAAMDKQHPDKSTGKKVEFAKKKKANISKKKVSKNKATKKVSKAIALRKGSPSAKTTKEAVYKKGVKKKMVPALRKGSPSAKTTKEAVYKKGVKKKMVPALRKGSPSAKTTKEAVYKKTTKARIAKGKGKFLRKLGIGGAVIAGGTALYMASKDTKKKKAAKKKAVVQVKDKGDLGLSPREAQELNMPRKKKATFKSPTKQVKPRFSKEQLAKAQRNRVAASKRESERAVSDVMKAFKGGMTPAEMQRKRKVKAWLKRRDKVDYGDRISRYEKLIEQKFGAQRKQYKLKKFGEVATRVKKDMTTYRLPDKIKKQVKKVTKGANATTYRTPDRIKKKVKKLTR